MAWRKAAAAFGAAVVMMAFTLLLQVSAAETWNSVGQPELKSMRRHKLRESMRIKALNKRRGISSFELYPQLTQQIRCQQLIDQEVPPLSQTCTDDACLVEAMFMKTPLIIIDHDIDISNSLPLPTITTKMVISGKCLDHACMIDAFGVGQIFVVSVGGQLTLQNLEIKGGYFSEGGAAVTVAGSRANDQDPSGKLLALNVLFFNNSASSKGGAILVEQGGALYVQNSVFDSNEALMGGAVYVQSSNDNDTDNTGCGSNSCATFIGTAFMGNWADLGGAIYVNDGTANCIPPGKFECTTCSFDNNFALDDGGAIFLARIYRGAIGNVKFSSFYNNFVEVASHMTGGTVAIEAGEPGGIGVQYNSFKSIYSQSINNTNNTIACYGVCNFCPVLTKAFYLAKSCNNSKLTSNPTTPFKTCPNCHIIYVIGFLSNAIYQY